MSNTDWLGEVEVAAKHSYEGGRCGCGAPIPGATREERLLWHESHVRAAWVDSQAARSPGVPIVDLAATVGGLLAHAASLRAAAAYLEQVAAVLTGGDHGNTRTG